MFLALTTTISSASTLAALLIMARGLAACGGLDDGGEGGGDKLGLVAYSTPKEAYGEIIPAFA